MAASRKKSAAVLALSPGPFRNARPDRGRGGRCVKYVTATPSMQDPGGGTGPLDQGLEGSDFERRLIRPLPGRSHREAGWLVTCRRSPDLHTLKRRDPWFKGAGLVRSPDLVQSPASAPAMTHAGEENRQIMPTVTVDGEKSFEVEPGKKLVLAIEDAGIDIMHRCGGNAKCTTCRVEVLGGDVAAPEGLEQARLAREGEIAPNIRLSCQIRVNSDLWVAVINRRGSGNSGGAAARRLIRFGTRRPFAFDASSIKMLKNADSWESDRFTSRSRNMETELKSAQASRHRIWDAFPIHVPASAATFAGFRTGPRPTSFQSRSGPRSSTRNW